MKSDKNGRFTKAIVRQNGQNVNFKVQKIYLKRLQKRVSVVLFQKGLEKTPHWRNGNILKSGHFANVLSRQNDKKWPTMGLNFYVQKCFAITIAPLKNG